MTTGRSTKFAKPGGSCIAKARLLADSTIYEMEQPGDFPRRFALWPRCIVWDLTEVHA